MIRMTQTAGAMLRRTGGTMKARSVVGMLSMIASTNYIIPAETREKVWEILSSLDKNSDRTPPDRVGVPEIMVTKCPRLI